MHEPALLCAALGAIVGLILALTGAGGGILAVPMLVFALDLSIKQAAPVGLITVGLAAAVGTALGLRDGTVRYRAAALIGATGMAFAPIGLYFAQRIPNVPLMIGFALVLALVAWRIFRHAGERHSRPDGAGATPPCVVNRSDGRLLWTLPCARTLAVTGALSGTLSGLLGVGGGFVIVPALTRNTDLDMLSIMATSLAVIALVSASGVIAAALGGAVAWDIALPFSAGAVLALLVGRRIARNIASAKLQRGFAVISAGVCLMLLARSVGWMAA